MIEALYDSGLIADLIVVFVVLEAVGLIWLHRRDDQPGLPWGLLLTLLPGAALVMALGAALRDADWIWVGVWLLLALVSHLADIGSRWWRTYRGRS